MDQINEALTRAVENLYPNRDFIESALRDGKKLRVYTGIDPTGELHIGHMAVLRKLKQFQEMGHEVIVLIGDFTARIGDPTDKLAARKKLSKEEVENNAKNWKQLIGKILDTTHANLRFLHNEEWTNKLKPEDLLELASYFTVQQLLERDMFQKRLKEGKEIYLHEFLYPIFQAYDSDTMDVDMEIGGNDQTFNMLAGRNLMKKVKNKEKMVISTKLLVDPQGKKMGKTEGNMVMLSDSPEDIFGKIMAFPDEFILVGYELLTDKPQSEIEKLKADLDGHVNPKDAKSDLAYDVVKQLYSEQEAGRAKESFDKVHRQKEMPEKIEEVEVKADEISLIDALMESRLASSRSQALRLVEQGGVKVDGEKAVSADKKISLDKSTVLQVGKLNFVKLVRGNSKSN